MQLKPKFIEKQYSLMADLYFGVYGFILSMFLSFGLITIGNTHPQLTFGTGLFVTFIVLVWIVWQHIYINGLLKARGNAIEVLALRNAQECEYSPASPVTPEFAASSLMDLATRDLQTANYLKTADWSYMDLSYAVYQQTKNGEYKQATIYYALMATDLPRILPNVLFDSKKDRNRQFKARFASDQRHELEGNFNEYFDTYFAEGYTLDSMSFITPDVMQAMVEASGYDIEIVENHLLMYGPVGEATAQLQDMSQKLAAIKKSLLVTAADYRDDRLPGPAAQTTVTPQGMFLKQSKPHITIGLIVGITYLVARILMIVFWPQ